MNGFNPRRTILIPRVKAVNNCVCGGSTRSIRGKPGTKGRSLKPQLGRDREDVRYG